MHSVLDQRAANAVSSVMAGTRKPQAQCEQEEVYELGLNSITLTPIDRHE